VSVCSGDRARAVRLLFKKREVEVSGEGEAGGAQAILTADRVSEGLAATFSVSGKFFAEGLAATDDELVELTFGAAMDPVVIHGSGGRYLGLVMPMRGEGGNE
jgi:hypothetical protein